MNGLPLAAIHRARIAGLGLSPAHLQALAPRSPAGASFAETLKQALNEVSAVQDTARSATDAFLRGEPIELHQVMAAAEEAGIAVELLVEVRNKFIDAYRTLINMQS